MSDFLTAHQHKRGLSVPTIGDDYRTVKSKIEKHRKIVERDEIEKYKMVSVKARLYYYI